ncbi:protein CANDIDATE G-PROTEIN COUPLED RECEPTOR 7-like [Curcuma longa]|uniref:protein CANDIDATE G-PROTEIN COUPLED RECEPTOR 7-like n=1 Tax=Curcuma longa TaxID=136217 RepID=UPI003D9DC295
MFGRLAPFLLIPLLFSLFSPSGAEIKTLKITSDSRAIILFEEFGFTVSGEVSVTVSNVSFPSSSSDELFGFFLVSDARMLQLVHDSEQPNQSPAPLPSCALQSTYVEQLFTFHEVVATPSHNFTKLFAVGRDGHPAHPDEYGLYFANCAPDAFVSMTVRTEMYNVRPDGTRDYLSVGQSAVPSIYAFFSVAYFAGLITWAYICFRNRLDAHRIHLLMAALLLAKALDLLFAAEDLHYTRSTGTPHGWDILFYVFKFVKGVLLFTVIVLIGTGWSFLKPFLQEREKKVLAIVIPLQVIANIASAVIGETGPFLKGWVKWKQIFLLIDVACCCAVLFPIIWSIRTLKETSKTDGKAARTLAKLTLFRKFYIAVIGYLYFTRIVVYALKTITSYKYRWASVMAEETVTFAFYVFMFYMFRPKERNEYFVLDDDEEEAAEAALREEEFEL